MTTHDFMAAELAEQRSRALRAEADAHRLARVAVRARAASDTTAPDTTAPDAAAPGAAVERPRRWVRPWGRPGTRPA